MYTPSEHTCTKCSNIIRWYTAAQSRHVYCAKCGAYYLGTKGELQKQKADRSLERSISYTLKHGSTAKLDGTDYTLIAAVIKEDANYPEFRWIEYTLFNIEKGYTYLSEAGGHWMQLWELDGLPEKTRLGQAVFLNDTEFAIFQKSRSNVIHAMGEFPSSPLMRGVKYEEFIAPPSLLSCEYGSTGLTWFEGTHISSSDVAKAFGIDKNTLPPKGGVGAVQPFGSNVAQTTLNAIGVIAAALLFLFHFLFSGAQAHKEVLNYAHYTLDSLSVDKSVSPSFTVTQNTGALEFTYKSNCYNNWSEADIELYNEGTGETRGLTTGAEYYAGRDSDGSWTEGDQQTSVIMSSVDPGKYHLNVAHQRGGSNTSGNSVTISVLQDAPITSNMFVCLLLLVVYPIVQYFRRRAFEARRWAVSDYSPYSTTPDGDDE